MSGNTGISLEKVPFADYYYDLEKSLENQYVVIQFTDDERSQQFAFILTNILELNIKVSHFEKVIDNSQDAVGVSNIYCVKIDYSQVEKSDKMYKDLEPLLRNIPSAKKKLSSTFKREASKVGVYGNHSCTYGGYSYFGVEDAKFPESE